MTSEPESCGNCRFWRKMENMCHRLPPTTALVGLQPSPLANQPGQPIWASSFAPIRNNGWCGEWCGFDTALVKGLQP